VPTLQFKHFALLALLAPLFPCNAALALEVEPVPPDSSVLEVSDIRSVDAPEPTPDDWAFTVEAYGYLPWVDATTTVSGFETTTYLPPGDLLNILQSVFMARASAEKGRWGVLADVAYTQLGAEQSRTTRRGLFTGSAQVTSINGLYDLAIRYRFGARESAIGKAGHYWIIPYMGLRVVEAQLGVNAEIIGNGPLGLSFESQASLNHTWSQLLLGTQASLFLTPTLRAFVRADIGGFGMAGSRDLSGNAQVGFGYALGNSTDLSVSWRYTGIAYDNGASRSTGYTSDQDGVEVGLKFYF
jgi:hypothetical protein